MSVDATRATWKLGKKITAIQKLILLALADRCGEGAECWPSLKRMMADTNLDRKTLITNRQQLIDKGLIEYTGRLAGSSNQIPVMRLTYVIHREDSTSTENGTGEFFTSTEIGTGTSTVFGTRNLKEETKKNNNNKNAISVKKNKTSKTLVTKKGELGLNELLDCNPFNIPAAYLSDYMLNRNKKKSPLTMTAWSMLNKELAKCENPIEAFAEVVTRGWLGFKSSWVDKDKSHFNNNNTSWIKRVHEEIF